MNELAAITNARVAITPSVTRGEAGARVPDEGDAREERADDSGLAYLPGVTSPNDSVPPFLVRVPDALPFGIFARSLDGKMLWTNAAFEEIVGIRGKIGGSTTEAVHAYGLEHRDGRPYAADELPSHRVITTGEAVVDDDLVLCRPDGTRLRVRVFANPLRDADARLIGTVIAFLDVSREASLIADLETTSARLQATLEHSPVAIWTIGLDGDITLSEGAALETLGVRPGELVGRSVFELYDEHPQIAGYIHEALAGSSFSYTVDIGNAQLQSWVSPLRDPSGRITGAIGVSTDTTENRHLQARVIESDRVRTLGLLAASVAHEINNPLSYITTGLGGVSDELTRLRGLLDRVAAGDASQVDRARAQAQRLERLLRPVREGIERVSHVTRDLEVLSHQETEARGPVDASGAMRTAIDLAYKEIMNRARVRLDLGDTAFVDASEPRLVQVFLNLLMNAAYAIPDNADRAEVRARVVRDGDDVLVEVSDTGPSASEEDRAIIFEPFMSADPKGEGTGLGLFVCRTIIERLGGTIEVDEREGGGTLMRLRLPRSATDPSNLVPVTPRLGPSRPGRILLVDDDVRVARTLADALESHEHRVVVAFSGREALDHIDESSDFDLVLCDLMMPLPSGIEVYAGIAERAPQLTGRFLFMTGGAFTERARSFLRDSGLPYVEKPFDVVAEVSRRLRLR